MLRLLLVVASLALLTEGALAQGPLEARVAAARAPGASFYVLKPSRPERFARTGSILGLVTSGLLIGGSVAIATVDHRPSELATRSVHLAVTAATAPLVAFSAYLLRKRQGVRGYAKVRSIGWVTYTGAIASGVAQVYWAAHDESSTMALTITNGALAALSILPHAFDAYVGVRHARIRRIRFGVLPGGVRATF